METQCPPTSSPVGQSSHNEIQTEEIFHCSYPSCDFYSGCKENVGRGKACPTPFANVDFICQVCNQNCPFLFNFLDHMSSEHPNRPFCPLCPFHFVESTSHILTHNLTQPVSVPTSPSNCNPENVDNFDAQTPKATLEKGREEFENCNVTLEAPAEDEQNLNRASTKNELRCSTCNKTYTHVSHLQRHQKNWFESNNLKMHSHKNSTQKPFKCHKLGCKYSGRRLQGLQIHQRSCRLGIESHTAAAETSDEISIVAVVDKKRLDETTELALNTPLQESNLGPAIQCETETEVEENNNYSNMVFACTLCDFIGDSELSALEHARQHTADKASSGRVH